MTEMFHYALGDDGVAVITWDIGPDRSMNVLSEKGIHELEAHIDAALADEAVKGVVLASGKPDFAGGMDLNVLAGVRAAAAEHPNPGQAVFEFLMQMHHLLRKIERAGADPKTNKGGKPIAVATPGTSLGIGYEIMLACHRRFAAENPSAKIGLPEIKVGLFPGAGGTTRLIRMLGLMGAAPYLLQGKLLDPQKAKAAGLVDELAPADELITRAREWVLLAKPADLVKPWDQKKFKLPGGAPYHPAGFQTFLGGAAMAHGESQGAYPAVKALLAAAYEGALVNFDAALRVEARWFSKVLLDPTSSAMIRTLFVNKQAIEKGARRPEGEAAAPTARLGVLGAGMMGAGVAHSALSAGVEVVLIDRDDAGLARGRASIEALLEEGVKRRKLTAEQKEQTLARLNATTDYAALSNCDLLVEAVFEDPAVKAEAIRLAEEHLPPDAIFASNTSTLPISDLAAASKRPDRFIGVHFFSPVHKMLLVEIIKGRETSAAAIAKAFDFVRQLKKTPVLVNDARFFYANRCIIPYINEGVRMLAEGVRPALIENAAKQAGMPLGPLQLTDEISLELGLKIAVATKAALGDAYPESPADEVLRQLVEDEGRLGRKASAGFYDYDERGKRAGLWPGLAQIAQPSIEQPSVEEVKDRLLAIQALEAVRAYEQGVLSDVREGDVGAILGWGFAPWSGGPFSWIDMQGPGAFVETCRDLESRHGDRFSTPEGLLQLAQAKGAYYAM